jgi:xylan 1,4-beta-xylosidase
MPNFCVGAGRANEGLRADWQQQLKTIHDECGFRYLRFHGLLCDDMGVYLFDKHGNPTYNWQYIDALFDAMLDMGVRPFVEIGFMPSGLSSGPSTIFWWKGNVTPPNDYEKWAGFIQALIAHWTERYGAEELYKWYFEVWNEPNLSGFWIGDRKGMDDKEFMDYAQSEYFKLYKYTAEAVKAVDPKYKVGGPATAGNAWVPEMIDFCVKNDAPIDFVATHNYAVKAGYLDEKGNAGTVFCENRDAMIRDVTGVRKQIAESERPDLELYYTEWSASYTPSDPIHDSYHSAAFILNKVKGVGDAAQGMSYWTFTDIFEEAGPRTTPFHGGFGLSNYQGIHKPAYFAYKFFNQLDGLELVNKDADAWVTKNENGDIKALFWDFTITHPGDSVNNQDFYNKELPAQVTKPVELTVEHVVPGDYKMKIYRVGYRSNDAYTSYLDMEAPQQLTRSQVEKLKKVASGEPSETKIIHIGNDGKISDTFNMKENDVVLVTYEKL